MSGLDTVDWETASRVARRVSARQPFATSYLSPELIRDFEEFTATAEQLVGETTGLWSTTGHPRGRVIDRESWVDVNIATFQRMLRPLLDKMGERLSHGPVARFGRKITGAEVGAMLGWMSTRVLGQYDLLIVEDEFPEDQDLVYYVGPNVVGIEKKYAFEPREFRLWLALHEVTHRAQFTGIPWMREHFLSLVHETLDSVDPDPSRFIEAMRRTLEKRRTGEDPLADGGVAALLASPEQRETLDKISGMMSLLEGHGDVTMDRAGADRIPGAERFGRVLRQRRQQTTGLMKLLQRIIGLDAKIKQYEQGEAFIEAVEGVGGPELVERAWEHPDHLPTIQEIRDPDAWVERVGVSVPA